MRALDRLRRPWGVAGLVFLLGGLGVAAIDLAGPGGMLRSAGAWWYMLDRASLNGAQAGIQRYVAPWLWDPVLQSVLLVPLAGLIGGLGLVCLAIALARRG